MNVNYIMSESELDENLKKRNQNDPKEVAIKNKIKKLVLKNEWANDAISEITDLQRECMTNVINCVDDIDFVFEKSQAAFCDVATRYNVQFADEESLALLKKIKPKTPILIATNHLGVYKLCSIDTKDVGVDMEGYPNMYPFWAYTAGLYPIAKELDLTLSYVSNEFPGVFGDVHKRAGFVRIPTKKGASVAVVQEQIEEVISKHPNTAFVYFPEGTTSGKPNESDPYHIMPFRKGLYAIAHNLQLQRVLVAQFFHPEKGLVIKVLAVDFVPPSEDSVAVCQEFASRDQELIQEWLDSILKKVHPEVLDSRIKS